MRTRAYIVLAHCNFDDVLVGYYRNLADAKSRACEIEANPKLRFKTSDQACDTGYICTGVYAIKGPCKFSCVFRTNVELKVKTA